MKSECAPWLERLIDLRKSRSRGVAPHKPLLHLVVLDLYEAGKLCGGEFLRDGELAFLFNSYWTLGAQGRRSKPDVKLPFYHTRSDGFWETYEEDGRVARARDIARVARLDPGYLACLSDPAFRAEARRVIVTTHFDGATRHALAEFLHLSLEQDPSPEAGGFEGQRKSESASKREARFALEVLPAYDFTCALTRYRVVAEDGTTALDAAHIRRFSDGGPNEIRNGIALSKTAHWLFDRGFWSLDDRCRILVKTRTFDERGDPAHLLKPRVGTAILLPRHPASHPAPEFLAWHRAAHGF